MDDEAMYDEAVNAVQNGEITRARDLLTRLIKLEPRNVSCWILMSAVVETPKERIYCLQEALKIDPTNEVARRGLILAGAMPRDEKLTAIGPIRRNWQAALQNEIEKKEPVNWRIIILAVFSSLLVVALIAQAVLTTRTNKSVGSTLRPANTLKPSATYLPKEISFTSTPQPSMTGPAPLSALLSVPYTPTPIYGLTPYPLEDYTLGMRRYVAGDCNGAISSFQQVMTPEPGAADVLYYLAECNRHMGNNSAAMAEYNLALQINPYYGPAYLGRALLNVNINPKFDLRSELQKDAGKDPNFGEIYLQLAAVDLNENQYQAALNDVSQAEKNLPGSPLVFLYRAQAYLGLNKPVDALQNAEKANQLDITMLLGYRVLSQALQANNQMLDSIKPLKTYLIYQSDDATAWVLLGNAWYAQKNTSDALSAFNQALSLSSGLFGAYLGRGVIYLDQQDNQKALSDLTTAAGLKPDSFAANLDLGRAYLQDTSFTKAVDQFDTAEKLAVSNEDFAGVYYWRATTFVAAGSPYVALADWRRLLALPASAVPQDWATTAQNQINEMTTATLSSGATRTITPTLKPSPTP